MQLFNSLCVPGQQTISKLNVNIDKVNVKCLQVLQPLLIEMEDLNEELD